MLSAQTTVCDKWEKIPQLYIPLIYIFDIYLYILIHTYWYIFFDTMTYHSIRCNLTESFCIKVIFCDIHFSYFISYSVSCPLYFQSKSKEALQMSFFVQPIVHIQRYSVSYDIKQRAAANPHIWEARNSKCLAFLLEKWLIYSTGFGSN